MGDWTLDSSSKFTRSMHQQWKVYASSIASALDADRKLFAQSQEFGERIQIFKTPLPKLEIIFVGLCKNNGATTNLLDESFEDSTHVRNEVQEEKAIVFKLESVLQQLGTMKQERATKISDLKQRVHIF